jgi:glucose/arabinose dehydrogenase
MGTRLPDARTLVRVAAAFVALPLIATCADHPTAPPETSSPTSSPTGAIDATEDAVVLVGAGNIARCDRLNDERTAALLDGIEGTVFTTGDNTLGSTDEFQNCYEPSWGRHRARTRPAPGEREYWTPEGAEYFAYFGSAATSDTGDPYYSYDLGAWHIVVLNSNIDITATSPQVAWLKADLAATTQPCVLAYWDHPRFSSYGTGKRSAVKPFWDALYAAQADVVVNGHYRLYERFAPQTPAEIADPKRGIRQFTVGTGGQGINHPGTPRPNSEVRGSGIYGVLKFTLHSASYSWYSWEFIPIPGHTFTDTGTGQCHGRPGSSVPNQSPSPAIATPAEGTMYSGGDVIDYSGSASDPEDGPLPPERLTWWVDFHHDTHTHPFLPPTSGTEGGTVTIPTEGETSDNVWYRFYLVAIDAQGAADTVYQDVLPNKVTLTLTSQPEGLEITLDGQPRLTPVSVSAVVGIQRELGVVSPLTLGSTTYTFESWSDGGAPTHTIATPGTDATYTATFTETTSTNEPPVVNLTVPANGASAEVNTPVTMSAYALDNDGGILWVDFFDGPTLIERDDTDPFSVVWTPTTTGTRNLTARATDNLNAATTSAPVSFTVTSPSGQDTERPVATLTDPPDQSTSVTGTITLRAMASDNVGVVGVQFQVDGENLGAEDTAPPYETTLPSTSAYTTGIHVLRARARDAAGNVSPWSVSTVRFGGAIDLPAGFSRTTYTSGLSAVTAMAFAPDGRLFICEQNGQMRVVPAGGGAPLSTPFHTFTVTNSGEQGLLGIAFHPDFSSNGWIYVYYTSPTPTNHNRISRIVASSANPDVSTGVETILLDDLPTVPAGDNHNGGAIHFSPVDGKLYVAAGDQGTGSNAPSMTSRFGKILRYNDDLTIPTDNPFYTTATGVYRAIWALGLRNPFTFGFQPTTGRMFINDVGEAAWEEINEGVAGSNYGWPTTEGPTSDPRFRGPVFAYQHGGTVLSGHAIVGAAFYNPATTTFPAPYVGDYFFADYVSGWINRMDVANDNAVYAFARIGDSIFDLKVGPDGALYALAAGGTFLVYRYQYQ